MHCKLRVASTLRDVGVGFVPRCTSVGTNVTSVVTRAAPPECVIGKGQIWLWIHNGRESHAVETEDDSTSSLSLIKNMTGLGHLNFEFDYPSDLLRHGSKDFGS